MSDAISILLFCRMANNSSLWSFGPSEFQVRVRREFEVMLLFATFSAMRFEISVVRREIRGFIIKLNSSMNLEKNISLLFGAELLLGK